MDPSQTPSSSYGSPRQDVRLMTLYEEGESDLLPMARDRCNTWPLRRPQMDLTNTTSPLIHEGIPEERDEFDSSDQLNVMGLSMGGDTPNGLNDSSAASVYSSSICSPTGGSTSLLFNGLDTSAGNKKGATRRNAWGNMSYADLITQAILQSPEKRLTLSQVYEWMVQNVPYFRDKGDSNSSAGWKNSIRHNLSLHSRFMRIQNEGAGKSSWWVINPDAKPGRNPRRTRATTMDTATKAVMDKKRRGARKKVMDLRGSSSALSVSSSGVGGSSSSILSHDVYSGQPNDDSLVSNYDLFRTRAASTSVVTGSSLNRSSPTLDQFDDFDFPPWVDSSGATNAVAIPSDILDRTDQMRIDALRGANGLPREIKQELKTVIKSEPGVAPPPSYQELSSVRGPQQLTQNPLLRGQLMKPPTGIPYLTNLNSYAWGPLGVPPNSCGVTASQVSVQSALPIDLENLTLPDQPLMDMDMESILRHELSQTNNQLNFDI
uniref:Forkhead box protein O n=1 Tax=Pristionchus pacificus TaxID=54126 RepID=L0CML2_PRIPA|nr:forkhead transcription factor DAF-16 [Pristionchus pacificus]